MDVRLDAVWDGKHPEYWDGTKFVYQSKEMSVPHRKDSGEMPDFTKVAQWMNWRENEGVWVQFASASLQGLASRPWSRDEVVSNAAKFADSMMEELLARRASSWAAKGEPAQKEKRLGIAMDGIAQGDVVEITKEGDKILVRTLR